MRRLVLAFGGMLTATAATAAPNLVVNGDFEQTTLTTSTQMNKTNVTGWSTSGYTMLFFPGQADTVGAFDQYSTAPSSNYLQLWGPNNGGVVSPGGASQNLGVSPTGGNFLAADGAYLTRPITQSVSGLVAGTDYRLAFYWAAAQQQG